MLKENFLLHHTWTSSKSWILRELRPPWGSVAVQGGERWNPIGEVYWTVMFLCVWPGARQSWGFGLLARIGDAFAEKHRSRRRGSPQQNHQNRCCRSGLPYSGNEWISECKSERPKFASWVRCVQACLHLHWDMWYLHAFCHCTDV